MAVSSDLITSANLVKAMKNNPVLVCRTMNELREKGFFQSEKGHGGGWRLVHKKLQQQLSNSEKVCGVTGRG